MLPWVSPARCSSVPQKQCLTVRGGCVIAVGDCHHCFSCFALSSSKPVHVVSRYRSWNFPSVSLPQPKRRTYCNNTANTDQSWHLRGEGQQRAMHPSHKCSSLPIAQRKKRTCFPQMTRGQGQGDARGHPSWEGVAIRHRPLCIVIIVHPPQIPSCWQWKGTEHALCWIVKEGHHHWHQRQEWHPIDGLNGDAIVDDMTLLAFSLLLPDQQMFYVSSMFDYCSQN